MATEGIKKKNKKYIIAICALCIALVVAVGGAIGIYAASTQSVGSSFVVNYDVGNNVAFKIRAFIQYEGDEAYSEIGTMQYNVDGSVDGSIAKQNIVFTTEKSKARILYVLENLNDNDMYFTVRWNDIQDYKDANYGTTEKMSNVYISWNTGGHTYGPPGMSLEEALEFQASLGFAGLQTDPDGNALYINAPIGDEFASYRIPVNEDDYFFFGIQIGVADLNKNAYCTSEGEDGLTFIFTDSDVVNG